MMNSYVKENNNNNRTSSLFFYIYCIRPFSQMRMGARVAGSGGRLA